MGGRFNPESRSGDRKEQTTYPERFRHLLRFRLAANSVLRQLRLMLYSFAPFLDSSLIDLFLGSNRVLYPRLAFKFLKNK
jgi:hypothetical protein